MTKENKLENDKEIIDWSEAYKIEADPQIDLTPSTEELHRNTRKAKNNSEPFLSQDDINHWSKVYPIEEDSKKPSDEVEYEGNQILPPVKKIKSILYFTDLDTEDNTLDMNLKEVPEIQNSSNKLQDKISQLRNNSIDDSNSPKPR